MDLFELGARVEKGRRAIESLQLQQHAHRLGAAAQYCQLEHREAIRGGAQRARAIKGQERLQTRYKSKRRCHVRSRHSRRSDVMYVRVSALQ